MRAPRRRDAAPGGAASASRSAAASSTSPRTGCSTRQAQEVPITSMEFDLLKVFTEHPNKVLTRDQILTLTRNREWEPFDRSIDIRIARLRRKIEVNPEEPQAMRTVRGAGYMFVPACQGLGEASTAASTPSSESMSRADCGPRRAAASAGLYVSAV